MTKNIILSVLSIFSIYTHAASVVFSDDLSFDNCKAPSNVPVVVCENGGKRAIVQINSRGHLLGLVTEGGTSKTFAVKQIVENGVPTYYNSLSDKINEERATSEFTTPITKLQEIAERKKSIEQAIEIAKKENSNILEDLEDFDSDLDDSLNKLKSVVAQASNLLWVNTKKDGNIHCEMSTKCPIKKCGDNHFFIFDPSRNIFMPINYTRDSRGNAKFTKSDSQITIARTMNGAVLELNDDYKTSRLTAARKAPQNLQSNPTAYFSFQDARFSDYLKTIIPHCSQNIKDDIISLGVQTNNERANLDFVHLVEVVNGTINSQYINKKFLPKNSCRDGDSYYTAESYKESQEFVPRSSGVISWKKAGELFEKAKKMKELTWRYTADGCYARAELMVNMMEEEGVIADKAWTSGYLKSKSSPHPWSYHVAPVVYVNNGRGHVQKMIIDPAVANGPVEPDEWLRLMGVNEKNLDQVGFPPSLDAVSVGRNTFTISDRSTFHPQDKTRLTKEQRVTAARALLTDLGKRLQ